MNFRRRSINRQLSDSVMCELLVAKHGKLSAYLNHTFLPCTVKILVGRSDHYLLAACQQILRIQRELALMESDDFENSGGAVVT